MNISVLRMSEDISILADWSREVEREEMDAWHTLYALYSSFPSSTPLYLSIYHPSPSSLPVILALSNKCSIQIQPPTPITAGKKYSYTSFCYVSDIQLGTASLSFSLFLLIFISFPLPYSNNTPIYIHLISPLK